MSRIQQTFQEDQLYLMNGYERALYILGANKKQALEHFIEINKLNPEAVGFFGDSFNEGRNDYPILSYPKVVSINVGPPPAQDLGEIPGELITIKGGPPLLHELIKNIYKILSTKTKQVDRKSSLYDILDIINNITIINNIKKLLQQIFDPNKKLLIDYDIYRIESIQRAV